MGCVMTVIAYNNNNNWTAPATGIVMVECWGSGGGAGANNVANAAGGGGGGAYARGNVYVEKGKTYLIIAPPGGNNSANNGNGTAGADSYFGLNCGTANAMRLVQADGGNNGRGNGAAGIPGTVAASVGNLAFAGGNGAAGVAVTGIGGGGGAGGGDIAKGANAVNNLGGEGANNGGAGGNGGGPGENGENGSFPGGGGGGAGNLNGGPARSGGNGGRGQVVITYNESVAISGKVTVGGANLPNARVLVVASDDTNAANSVLADVVTANAEGVWSATASANKVLHAVVQHNNATAQYAAKSCPFIPS